MSANFGTPWLRKSGRTEMPPYSAICCSLAGGTPGQVVLTIVDLCYQYQLVAICRSHPQFIDVYSRHIISGVVMNQVTTGAPAPCGLIAVYFAIESTRRELKHWNAVPLACVCLLLCFKHVCTACTSFFCIMQIVHAIAPTNIDIHWP